MKHLKKIHSNEVCVVVCRRFRGILPELPDDVSGLMTDNDELNQAVDMDDDDMGLKISNVGSMDVSFNSIPNNQDTNLGISVDNEGMISFDRAHKGDVTKEKEFTDDGINLEEQLKQLGDNIEEETNPQSSPLYIKPEPYYDESEFGINHSNSSMAEEDSDNIDPDDDEDTYTSKLEDNKLKLKISFPRRDHSSERSIKSGSDVTSHNSPRKAAFQWPLHKCCCYCKYQTKWNVADVKIHILVVHLRKHAFGCSHCTFTNNDKRKIKIHIKREHNIDPSREVVYFYRQVNNSFLYYVVDLIIIMEVVICILNLNEVTCIKEDCLKQNTQKQQFLFTGTYINR